MNGQTSSAPILGCSPEWRLMSIRGKAAAAAASAASTTAVGDPTKVKTCGEFGIAALRGINGTLYHFDSVFLIAVTVFPLIFRAEIRKNVIMKQIAPVTEDRR